MTDILLNLADECDKKAAAIVDPVAKSQKWALFAHVARQAARAKDRADTMLALVEKAYNQADVNEHDERTARVLRCLLAQMRAL